MEWKVGRFWAAGLALALVGCLAAAATLGKDDVLAMARAGRSEQSILDAIRTSHSAFDLTADDIADLRRAGVSETVIQAMIDTAPPETDLTSGATAAPETAAASEQDQTQGQGQAQSQDQSQGQPTEDAGAVDQGPLEGPYAPPPWYAYPYYPMYYPVYYPVYDPFWPFFGGFFVSFEFVHCSRFFCVFPCDRSVVVFNTRVPLRGTSFFGRRTPVFTTPRTLPRGATSIGATLTASGSPSTRIATRPARLAPRAAVGSPAPGGPRGAMTPRGVMAPRSMGPAPRGALAPRGRPAARPMPGPGARAWSRPGPRPSFGVPPAPRFAAPPRPAPRFAPMPHGGFGGGGFHAAPAPRGGGHGHGGHH